MLRPFWQWDEGQPDRRNGSCGVAKLVQGSTFNISLTGCDKKLPFVCMNRGVSGLAKKGEDI